jgi:hypothetical protein
VVFPTIMVLIVNRSQEQLLIRPTPGANGHELIDLEQGACRYIIEPQSQYEICEVRPFSISCRGVHIYTSAQLTRKYVYVYSRRINNFSWFVRFNSNDKTYTMVDRYYIGVLSYDKYLPVTYVEGNTVTCNSMIMICLTFVLLLEILLGIAVILAGYYLYN